MSTDLSVTADLTLGANRYALADNTGDASGDIGVSGNEIDFFNADQCGRTLPDGVGRYAWSVLGNVLHLTALNQDPCGRTNHLAVQSFIRTSN